MTSPRMRLDEAPPPISPERRPASAVPEPPVPLDRATEGWWAFLWRTPVAATWTPSDEPIVLALAKLYALSDFEMGPGIAGQISSISSQLGLNPRSRAQLRVSTATTKATPIGAGRDRFRSVG